MTTYDIERTDEGFVLVHPVGPDEIYDSFAELVASHPVCGEADLSAACEWHCGVEDKWWPIAACQLNLAGRKAVRWTTTEAGIDNVEEIENRGEDDEYALLEWVRDIAANCGSCDGRVR